LDSTDDAPEECPHAYAHIRGDLGDHGRWHRRWLQRLFRRPRGQRESELASKATADQQFTGFQAFAFYNLTGDVNRLISMWTQQMAGTGRQWAGYDKYVVTENDFTFGGYYTGGGLVDIRGLRPRSRTTSCISASRKPGKR
jgi:hypothetical protein